MSRGVRRLVLFVLVVLLLAIPVPVFAQGAPTITLKASDTHFDFGKSPTLSGQITPATADQEIHILDENGRRVATTKTNGKGKFSVKLVKPRRNMDLRAQWLGTLSDVVPIRVRPVIDVNIGRVRLFDDVRAWGDIAPGNVSGRVTLELRRSGNVYKSRRVDVAPSGWFRTKFRVDKPGRFRVVARHDDADHQPAAASSNKSTTALPTLSSGSHSIYVKLLERRLKQLHYKVPPPDRHFDYRTSDNVIAFNKVQGRSRVGYVTESTWRALASPKVPKPKFSWPKYHIEVDQTKQVLYRVKKNKVISIMHVSTGAGSATRDGTFDFDSKLAGYSSKGLKYPSFFDGARAIHGWPSVPTYNASHGCVRVPMWQATWIFSKVEIGDLIHIYH
ncbi:MAG: L,D-transpeptidase family protein [Actinobacteria bacterium]|nr:L,D-transpeptidase family protein [Actinomycetota bacterium]